MQQRNTLAIKWTGTTSWLHYLCIHVTYKVGFVTWRLNFHWWWWLNTQIGRSFRFPQNWNYSNEIVIIYSQNFLDAFKKYLQKTYGIFHMLVTCRKHMENDPARSPPTYGNFHYVFCKYFLKASLIQKINNTPYHSLTLFRLLSNKPIWLISRV